MVQLISWSKTSPTLRIQYVYQDYINRVIRSDYQLISEPVFRDELIITFGATYKAVEGFWQEYVLRFERVLEGIDFVSIVMRLETEYMGTYSFFWKSKKPNDTVDSRDRWIDMPKWYFGVGYRNMWGHLLESQENRHEYPFGFFYPVQFDHTV